MLSSNKQKTYFLQIGLFGLTILTTTLAGIGWIANKAVLFGEHVITEHDIMNGLSFSIPFLGILTIHEFGHYITARLYKVKVSLPYYLPLWLGNLPTIGTIGAFIKLKSPVFSRKGYFDIGVAGPLAGFVAALGVLLYGFTHLPPAEYIFQVHPDYAKYGLDYAQYVYDLEGDQVTFGVGNNLLFLFFERFFVSDPSLVPNHYELIHYPWLWAGYLALFFTALNLLPIGQLDGGHVVYGLMGSRKHRIISRVLFLAFMFYAGLGVLNPYTQGIYELLMYVVFYTLFLFFAFHGLKLPNRRDTLMVSVAVLSLQLLTVYFFPGMEGFKGWLLYGLLLGRFLGLDHPKALYDEPMDFKRQLIGWIALLVFIISFSPQPFIVE